MSWSNSGNLMSGLILCLSLEMIDIIGFLTFPPMGLGTGLGLGLGIIFNPKFEILRECSKYRIRTLSRQRFLIRFESWRVKDFC